MKGKGGGKGQVQGLRRWEMEEQTPAEGDSSVGCQGWGTDRPSVESDRHMAWNLREGKVPGLPVGQVSGVWVCWACSAPE